MVRNKRRLWVDLSDDERASIQEYIADMRAARAKFSWAKLADRYNMNGQVLRLAADPAWAEAHRARVTQQRADQRDRHRHLPMSRSDAAMLRDQPIHLNYNQPRSLTAQQFGDPLPGRSALDTSASPPPADIDPDFRGGSDE